MPCYCHVHVMLHHIMWYHILSYHVMSCLCIFIWVTVYSIMDYLTLYHLSVTLVLFPPSNPCHGIKPCGLGSILDRYLWYVWIMVTVQPQNSSDKHFWRVHHVDCSFCWKPQPVHKSGAGIAFTMCNYGTTITVFLLAYIDHESKHVLNQQGRNWLMYRYHADSLHVDITNGVWNSRCTLQWVITTTNDDRTMLNILNTLEMANTYIIPTLTKVIW